MICWAWAFRKLANLRYTNLEHGQAQYRQELSRWAVPFRVSHARCYIYRIVRTVVLLALLGVCLSMIAVGSIFLYYTSDPSLPTIDTISDYHPKVSTRVLASDGRLIGEIFEERRTVVPRERIPRVIVDAFVDAEDAQFFEHHGLNYVGIVAGRTAKPGPSAASARRIDADPAACEDVCAEKQRTESQAQSAGNVSFAAAGKEAEQRGNPVAVSAQIYFGHGRYGIEEAARFYFGKSVTGVNPGEAALLASLPKGRKKSRRVAIRNGPSCVSAMSFRRWRGITTSRMPKRSGMRKRRFC